jgi:hypothetical protein
MELTRRNFIQSGAAMAAGAGAARPAPGDRITVGVIGGPQVVAQLDVHAGALDHLHGILVLDDRVRGLGDGDRRVKHIQLGLGFRLDALDDRLGASLDHVQHVVHRFDEGHLPVEGDELRNVAGGIRGLRPERRADLEHSVQAGRHKHLLVQLGRLG